MTVYGFYIYGDCRNSSGMNVSISKAERVMLEGRPFIKQYGEHLSSERPGDWWATEAEARSAAAGELLRIGNRLIGQARKVAEQPGTQLP